MSTYINKIRTASGDLQINYEALANLPTISNPNLLINSDFRNPINQRDGVVYEGHDRRVYTIDRWCHNATDYGRKLEVCSGYVRYSNPNSTYQSFWFQQFERVLPSDYYTITVNVKSVSGNNVWVGNMIRDGSGQPVWGNATCFNLQPGINTFTVNGEFAGLYFQASVSSAVELYWVKLECGKTSTQFSPRLFQEELNLCQRFFSIMGGTRAPGVEQDTNANTFTYVIPRTCMMALAPELSIRGTTTTNSTDGICVRTIGCAIIPGFTFSYSLRNWEVLIVAKSSAPLSNSCYETQLYINDAFKICLDAEIY